MRGGFGRFRYERPQPGLQIYSYDDAIYPPRAYRYHVQQNPASSALIGGPNATTPTPTTTSSSSSSGNILAEMQATAIVLPTIDADATCGPFMRSAGGVGGVGGIGVGSMSSGISGGGRSASAAPSHVTDASGPGMADAERRPPPRLRSFFDCFVPDENGTDVQSLMEVGRHAEPLNPFHYRELWGSAGTGAATAAAEAAVAAVKRDSPPAVKAEPRGDEEPTETPPPTAEHTVKSGATPGEEEEAKARGVAAARAASRATQAALQHTLRAVGVPEELASMVLLAARVPAGGRLTRKQEKALRIRAQRRPAPARPIRRGAKVYMPAYALPASGDAYGVAEVDGSTAGAVATGGLVDVTAAGPRVLRLAQSAAHRQRGVFGSVGGGVAAVGGSGKGGHGVGERMSAALLNEFAFDDGDDDEDGGRRGGTKRSRGEDYDGMDDDDDVPLIALGRWNQRGGAGSGANGSALAGGAGGVGGGGAAAAGMGGQLDEEAEEKSEDDDDLSSGMAEDDDDDANASSDGGGDRDSFGGGDDGGDDDY